MLIPQLGVRLRTERPQDRCRRGSCCGRAGGQSAHWGPALGLGAARLLLQGCGAAVGTAPGEPGARDARSPGPSGPGAWSAQRGWRVPLVL